MGSYDVAQICMNGHVITSMAGLYPENKKDFCIQCGEKTIMNCQNCDSPIKGYHDVPGVISFSEYVKPKYCENCGKPYPWTILLSDAAKELIELTDALNQEEKSDLQNSIDDLVRESPTTIVAQAKYKKYMGKVGGEIAKGLKDILVEVVSETVKKAIWGL